MDRIKVLIFALCAILFSVSASAATVTVISSGSVGRDDAYWAGIVKIDYNGQEMIGMFDTMATPDRWFLPDTTWEANLYTRADILAGAQVNFTSEKYSELASLFIHGLLGYNPPDPLWAAGSNECVWNTALPPQAIPEWYYGNLPYGESTLRDVCSNLSLTLNQNYDFSNTMWVLGNAYDPVHGIWIDQEMLVYPVSMLSTPIPPAVWLFGSGLLGMVAVTRTRRTKK